jgi:hypothetical protein
LFYFDDHVIPQNNALPWIKEDDAITPLELALGFTHPPQELVARDPHQGRNRFSSARGDQQQACRDAACSKSNCELNRIHAMKVARSERRDR